jgi:MFS family permease
VAANIARNRPAIRTRIRTRVDNPLTLVNSLQGEFDWDPETQGIILGAFYYGYAMSQPFGGVLAERYGGKWFMGFAVAREGLHQI